MSALIPSPTPGQTAGRCGHSRADSACTLMQIMNEGVMLLNPEGHVRFVNPATLRMLGMPEEALTNRTLAEVFDTRHNEPLLVDLKRLIDGQLDRVDGCPVMLGERALHLIFRNFPHAGGCGLLVSDVTQRTMQESRIAELNATMNASQQLLRKKNEELDASLKQMESLYQALGEANRVKSDFLSTTSHELRTPLNSIIGFLQLMAEGLCESPEEEKEYLDNALLSARHLLSLINDVLDVVKIEAGKMTMLIDDHDVEELLHEVDSLMQIQARERKLTLRYECRDAGLRMRADYQRTRQVLLNLLSNALKFTDEGSICTVARIDPDTPDAIRFEVIDTGIGIPPSQQGQIFEKFTQVDGSSKRRYQGTGLGLAITKSLVEVMGGTISVFSEGDGAGTTLTFTLPRGYHSGEAGSDEVANAFAELPRDF